MNRHRTIALLLALCFALTGRGENGSRWESLEVGMSEATASTILGTPLIIHGARGLVQWTFDAGGSVMFHRGSLLHWSTPKGYRPAPIKAAATVVVVEPPSPVETEPTSSRIETTLQGPTTPSTPTLRRPRSDVRVPSFDELRES